VICFEDKNVGITVCEAHLNIKVYNETFFSVGNFCLTDLPHVLNTTRTCYGAELHHTAIPLQAWTGPWGSSRLKFPEFLDNKHMKVVRSALRTGRLYPWYSFLLEAELTQGHSVARKTK
jgi:hypothetical protein